MSAAEDSTHPFHFPLPLAQSAPITPGMRSAQLFTHGTMSLRFYQPKGGVDEQTPHEQDEVYIIASGSGWFLNGDERHPFQSGDVLFVPARREHRFVDFSDDFATWVVFYGPGGGEAS